MILSSAFPDSLYAGVKEKIQKTPRHLLLFIFLTLSIFTSIILSSLLSVNNAYACEGGNVSGGGGELGSDGNASVGTGASGCGDALDGDGDGVPTETKRTSSSAQVPFNPELFTFPVNCSSYSDSGSSGNGNYKLSSYCAIPWQHVVQAAFDLGGPESWSKQGKTTYNGAIVYGTKLSSTFSGCPANGENSAYSANYRRAVMAESSVKTVIIFYSDMTTRTEYVYSTIEYIVSYEMLSCNYPQATPGETKKCYYNYNGTSTYSQNRGTIQNGGKLIKVRGVLPGDPGAPVWNGNENTAPTCEREGSENVRISQNLEENGYGYYRLSPTYSYKFYQQTNWVGGGKVFYSKWTNPNSGNGSHTRWFTYSCNADKPFEGPFGYGSLPDRSANFDPASCPQVNWQCELEDSTTIGLERSAIPAGQTKVTTPVTVMRNGESIPLTFSKLRVVDYTAGASVNVTNGVSGSGVRNVTGIDYKSNVKHGSTPFYGTDVNSNNQYFKQYKSFDTRDIEKWDGWLSNANTNVAKGISFNWASEGNASFAAERQYRVTAEFYVPRGTNIDSDGNAGSYGYKWIKDTKNCYEYDASGNQTPNMLTAISNPTNVVRSVGDAS